MPHCSAASSKNACCNGCNPSAVAMPSTVSTDLPLISAPRTKHESTMRPSSETVQAPPVAVQATLFSAGQSDDFTECV